MLKEGSANCRVKSIHVTQRRNVYVSQGLFHKLVRTEMLSSAEFLNLRSLVNPRSNMSLNLTETVLLLLNVLVVGTLLPKLQKLTNLHSGLGISSMTRNKRMKTHVSASTNRQTRNILTTSNSS